MAISSVMKKEELYIRDAIENGISAESINQTISNMLNNTNRFRSTPKQIREVIETIVDSKSSIRNIDDNTFSSGFVRKNNLKIKDALSNGIMPYEVVNSLSNNDGRKLKFTVRLISKMKKQELKLRNQKANQSNYQMVYKKGNM